jgi:endonuclease/exonuclease/phosphatase family metal-dependent hydrolase
MIFNSMTQPSPLLGTHRAPDLQNVPPNFVVPSGQRSPQGHAIDDFAGFNVNMCRRLIILLALFAAMSVAVPARAEVPRARPITVLSFNIHHAVGPDGRLDLPRVAAEIRVSNADVVGLQEVDRHFGARSEWADQPAELAALLGMHVAYAANLDLDPPAAGQPRRQYGTALLSRYPILSWRNTLLAKARPTEEQRGLLEAVVDVRGLAVRVMNTHLQHDNAASRVLQTQVIAGAVRASAEPVVLVGDLNATPATAEIRTLTDFMVDSHVAAGRGDGATYPVEAPVSRIDYVLTVGMWPITSRVLPTAASDHRPVLARFRAS